MKPYLLIAVASLAACAPSGQPRGANEPTTHRADWERRAQSITITRDDWGIPHIRAQTDADAVFGLIFAQAEDDFNRIEVNYLNAMGRLAEAEGESAIYRDLRMKLFIDTLDLKARYTESPEWLRALMNGWADGLNYFLATHPNVRPRVIGQFEPWMALSFSEGSIGGDIERVSLKDLESFYGGGPRTTVALKDDSLPQEPGGSNGFAIAPSKTATGHSLLLINPHTSFFFRAEVQVQSDEGLNAYGAVTWGQFFVYQGFNERAGWMHTSSGVDAIDEYAEVVTKKGDGFVYRYGTEERAVVAKTVVVPFKTDTGMAARTFTVYGTHHGPVIRSANGQWITLRLMQDPVKALTQSYSRTKAKNYQEFKATMDLHTNSSNNTVFADADGNIAYFHANFIPRRDTTFDWSKPVDGSNPATEWQPVFSVDESPNVLNPKRGWIQNTNNWPFTAAGPESPKQRDYPRYVETGTENPRGVHAIRVLDGKKDFTLARLIEAAYDSQLPAFENLLPALFADYAKLPAKDPLRAKLAEPIAALKAWDRRWATSSVPTSLAVYWGEDLWVRASADQDLEGLSLYDYMATKATAAMRLTSLEATVDKLTADFGTWKTPWGEINRFQRLTDDIVHPFDDAKPSLPVGFTSSRWGSLASFGARAYQGSKKIYGTYGNSFVAVVEFGDSVRARAVTAGGLSGNPSSPHFNDQAARYVAGDLRTVYFYPNQLKGHVEREYHPGS